MSFFFGEVPVPPRVFGAPAQTSVTWTGSVDILGKRAGFGEIVDPINQTVSRGKYGQFGTPVGQWHIHRGGYLVNVIEYNDNGVTMRVTQISPNGYSAVVYPAQQPPAPVSVPSPIIMNTVPSAPPMYPLRQ